jgi:FlaA1/EpsC-like NDP-sugar epimerase
LNNIADSLTDKTVLVTGCGGSIGSELCRQIVRFIPRKLILIDASEENLFNIQTELNNDLNYNSYHAVLARVQNQFLIENVFKNYNPDVVFHAAAYKHVPIMELNPWEAFFNNIMASWTVMEASQKYGVERFVLVSTDKAVRPTNVMGASKRVAELILKSFQGSTTRFMAVRFGNVLGSSGSVVPLFEKQIKNGGPVTVTHPEVTRYFMTIPEAVQLILQAGSMGEGGEIFVLRMGTPVKITDMARDLIRLSGKEPDKDIEIVHTGLRPGEKLYEELIAVGEDIEQTEHEEIMVLKSNSITNGFNDQKESKIWLDQKLDELRKLGLKMDALGIKDKLREIVGEYTPQKTSCVFEKN